MGASHKIPVALFAPLSIYFVDSSSTEYNSDILSKLIGVFPRSILLIYTFETMLVFNLSMERIAWFVPHLIWEVFDAAVEVVIQNGGKDMKCKTRSGAKL